MKKPTICYECVHCDRSNACAVCNAQPVPEKLNLVTGQRMRPRPLCVDKNDGACTDYQPLATKEGKLCVELSN